MTNSLRSEIAILAFVSILVTSSLVLWFSISSFETLYKRGAINDLNGLSENLSIALIIPTDEADLFNITNTLLTLDQYENVRFAAIYDANNGLLASHLGRTITADKSQDEILALPLIDFDAYKPLDYGMHILGNNIVVKKRIGDEILFLGDLVVANDLSGPLNESKKRLILEVLPLSFFTLALAIFIILAMQSKALMPLLQLTRFMRKIRDSKNYSLVANVRGKREIIELTEGFNEMMYDINKQTLKNQQKNTLLLEQQDKMERLANFDGLTGLPNRQHFMDKLRASLDFGRRNNEERILIFFDLDGFKAINDAFGHEIGDKLLCIVADKINNFIQESVLVARLGGDEFLMLVEQEVDDSIIIKNAEKFISMLSKAIKIEQWTIQTGVSLGVARASTANYQVSELVANADVAMYQAKELGRNRCMLFTPEMIEASRRKLNIANAIADGLQNKEFSLVYQPKVNEKGQFVGYEALARWHSESLGFVRPDEFIEIAEQSGKIGLITQWLIDQVANDIPAFLKINGQLKVSLNLSAHDISDPLLVSTVESTLQHYKVPPSAVEFEITESAYLNNFNQANQLIAGIRALGSFIALDDFGTGYSSLSYLTQIDIDTLKIDKQFIDDIATSHRSSVITKTIVEMAKHLNLEVCVEGVETKDQSDLLVSFGCHLMQGYYYGKPLPIKEALSRLEEVQVL